MLMVFLKVSRDPKSSPHKVKKLEFSLYLCEMMDINLIYCGYHFTIHESHYALYLKLTQYHMSITPQ